MRTQESIKELWRQVDYLNQHIEEALTRGKNQAGVNGLIKMRTAIMHAIEALDMLREGEDVRHMCRMRAQREIRGEVATDVA